MLSISKRTYASLFKQASTLAISLIAVVTLGQTPDPETQATAKELQETVARLNALDEWFSEAEKKRTRWLADIQRQDKDISRLNKEVNVTTRDLASLRAELKELTAEAEELKLQQQTQAAHIAKHVGAAYRLTGQDFLKQLLNQESPDTLDRMMRYHREFSASRLDVMAEYKETLIKLADTNAALTDRQVSLDERRDDLQQEQSTLAVQRGERSKLVAALEAEQETKEEEHNRLVRDRERLETLLTQLRTRASELDGSAFVAARGALPMPVPGRIRHAFGSRRADNRLRWHGIDIAAPHGSPVTSVFRGRVVFADWLRGFGFLTIVDHGSDYLTLYGHVDVLHKKVGDLVESGEVIADAGNSGGSQNPGVYFEVRFRGEPKDPIGWIDRS
ncbi:MAG: peptidoglycan DD-metalloendopeptidase family protein [Pseudomonadales bacterium]|nr:peptidoglycan DD-metalloendopeptidase family protein [Pseudomonadales bacterium]